MANCCRQTEIARCRELLAAQTPSAEDRPLAAPPTPSAPLDEPLTLCPHCGLGHWRCVWDAPRPSRAELFLLPLFWNTS